MTTSFDILLTGEPLPGRSREAAAQSLAALMRLTETQALGLLSGRETLIKRRLPADQVPRYLKAMEQAGVVARHEPVEADTAPTAAVPPPAPADRPAPLGLPALEPLAPLTAAPALKPLEPTTPAPATAPLTLAPMAAAAPAPQAEPAAEVECPACGAKQPKRTLCRDCGVDMPRMRAAQEDAKRQPAADSPFAPPQANVRDVAAVAAESETPGPLSLSFKGRIGRLRYLAYTLPAYLPLFVGAVLGGIVGGATRSGVGFGLFMIIGGVMTMVLAIRIMVLRLHDLNLSGKWLLLLVAVGGLAATGKMMVLGIMGLAVIGIGSLVLTFKAGSEEDNDFGAPPGPNTGWIKIGATLMIIFSLAGGFAKPNRFSAPNAAASAPAPFDQQERD